MNPRWTGLFGGAVCWYTAHELGFYFSDLDCRHGWILPSIHLVAFCACIVCALISFRSLKSNDESDRKARDLNEFVARLGTAAGSLFALVILWQGLSTFIYDGCAR